MNNRQRAYSRGLVNTMSGSSDTDFDFDLVEKSSAYHLSKAISS